MSINIIESDNDGRRWIELTGLDRGTGYKFKNSVFGITAEDIILDADGCGLTEGDPQTIAVRNAINADQKRGLYRIESQYFERADFFKQRIIELKKERGL